MKKTCGNEVQLASIPEGMAALVKGTQKTLDEWKTRSKRKRFRCQNIPGKILALCNDLQSMLLRQASRRPGSSKRSLPSLKSSRTSFFRLGYKAGDSGRKHGFWKSRTAGISTSCGGLLAISSFVVLVGCNVDEHVQNHYSWTIRSLVRINSFVLSEFRLRITEID